MYVLKQEYISSGMRQDRLWNLFFKATLSRQSTSPIQKYSPEGALYF